jgi:hypothetical protein
MKKTLTWEESDPIEQVDDAQNDDRKDELPKCAVCKQTPVRLPGGGVMHMCVTSEADWRRLHGPRLALSPDDVEALRCLVDVITNSRGVAGWHLNGDVAEWDEFGDGAAAIRAALAKLEEE